MIELHRLKEPLPYPEWKQDPEARLSVSNDREYADVPLWPFDEHRVLNEATGRVRIVVEGERSLVYALLGSDVTEREAALRSRMNRGEL